MEKIIIELSGNSKDLQATIDRLEKLGQVDKKNADQFKKSHAERQKGMAETKQSVSGLNDALESIGSKIVATLAVDRVMAFGRAIIDTRAEFQKFEAQLTTALGSNSSAQLALSRIKDFAQKTPFSVKEITETFVKLANRGITPTMDQLRKMGDLAAALGKPMEQLNEAVLDINNPERWKELGIQVTTQGNKIIGSFRGQRVEAERTTAGALKLVEAFGSLEGVAGGMEAQMQTLGGKLSNLDDAFESLKNSIGEASETIEGAFIEALTRGITEMEKAQHRANLLTKALKGSGKEFDVTESWMPTEERARLGLIAEQLEQFNVRYSESIDKNNIKTREGMDQQAEYTKQLGLSYQQAVALLKDSGAKYRELERLKELYKNANNQFQKSINDVEKAANKETNSLGLSTAELKKQEAQIKKEIDALDGLRKKLSELQFDQREKLTEDLKGEEKSEKLYSIKKQRIESDIETQKKEMGKTIQNTKRLNDALILLEQIKNQMLINLSLDFIKEIDGIRLKEEQDAIERNKRISDMEIETMRLNHEEEADIYEARLEATKKYFDDKIAIETDAKKKEELTKQKELEEAKLEEDESQRLKKYYAGLQSEAERHATEMMRIQGKTAEEMLAKELEFAKQNTQNLKDEFGEESLEYIRAKDHEIELEEKYNNLKKELRKENFKETVQSLNEIAQATLQAYETMIAGEISANETKINNQKDILETQRVLASKGLDNTLAFEQKRQDELYKQQLAAKKKQQKVKELEVFLNALAKFADDNPKTALSKALGLLAATKAAEAIFAEKGTLVGSHSEKWRGQRHMSGRDRLAVVEEGEGIIPVKKMAELGLNTKERFSNFLHTPFQEKIIPARSVIQQDFTAITNKLEEVKEAVSNIKQTHVDYVGFEMRIREVENKISKTTILGKRRI